MLWRPGLSQAGKLNPSTHPIDVGSKDFSWRLAIGYWKVSRRDVAHDNPYPRIDSRTTWLNVEEENCEDPPIPPPKYELRIVRHQGNDEMYARASSDIPRSRIVSCSSSPTMLSARTSLEAICSPTSKFGNAVMRSHYRPGSIRFFLRWWFGVRGRWGGGDRVCRRQGERGQDRRVSIRRECSRQQSCIRIPRCKPHPGR